MRQKHIKKFIINTDKSILHYSELINWIVCRRKSHQGWGVENIFCNFQPHLRI